VWHKCDCAREHESCSPLVAWRYFLIHTDDVRSTRLLSRTSHNLAFATRRVFFYFVPSCWNTPLCSNRNGSLHAVWTLAIKKQMPIAELEQFFFFIQNCVTSKDNFKRLRFKFLNLAVLKQYVNNSHECGRKWWSTHMHYVLRSKRHAQQSTTMHRGRRVFVEEPAENGMRAFTTLR